MTFVAAVAPVTIPERVPADSAAMTATSVLERTPWTELADLARAAGRDDLADVAVRASRRDASVLAARSRRRPGAPAIGWSSLTTAELAVGRLIAEGLSNKEIAARLFISRYTVESHVRNALQKLGMTSRVQLAAEVINRLHAGDDRLFEF